MYYFYFAFGDFEIGVVLEKMHSENCYNFVSRDSFTNLKKMFC